MYRVIVGALVLVACSDPGPRPVPFEEYAETAREAYCAWAVRCRHVPDDATCRRLLDPKAYDLRRGADGIRLGRLRYQPEAAGRCLSVAHDAICAAPAFIDASCADVFVGLVPRGGACTTQFDCADDAMCLEQSCEAGCCIGACGPPRVREPPPPQAAIGAACVSHFDCVYDAYCDEGRCRALPTEAGQHCQLGCATGDLYCDVASETCHAHPAVGAPCGAEAKCNPYVAFCDGTCKQRPGPGEPCDEVRFCIPSAICQSGTCAARGDPGAPCTRDAECENACDVAARSCAAYEACLP